MKRTFLLCTFVLAMTCLLVSCDPAQRDLEKMEKLVEKVEKNSDQLTAEDWEAIEQEYEDLSLRMEDHTYSDEELQRIAYLEGRLIAERLIIESKKLKGKIRGFIDGIGESIDSTDLKEEWDAGTQEFLDALDEISIEDLYEASTATE